MAELIQNSLISSNHCMDMPPKRGRPPTDPIIRLWSKVEKSDSCWTWKSTHSPQGYATFWLGGQKVLVHRLIYEQTVGAIPEGWHIDHLCHNRGCVNPYHLEPVTQRENLLRGEGLSAQYARRTHCKNGHPLEGDNLRKGRAFRECVICTKEYRHNYRLRTGC